MSLTKLVIKAIVNIGWRDRASIRESWIGRLERVFLRRYGPPDDSFNSPAAFSEFHKKLQQEIEYKGKERAHNRRSTRIAQREDGESQSTSFSATQSQLAGRSASLKSTRGSQVRIGKNARRYSPADAAPLFIQGLCDVVTVRIDNLRPAESQLTEADFLDSEASGDEEWTGKDADLAAGYAW
jgi:hypothetical protein